MKHAISALKLSKKYTIDAQRQPYQTITDSLATIVGSILGKTTSKKRISALKNLNVEIEPGEVVGVVGRNGSGKSTFLKILAGITEPTSGRAELHGSVASLLEVGTGFHPELSGRENIFFNGMLLGMSRAEVQSHFKDIVEFSGTKDFIDTPIKRYSSGMQLRLAFAVAAHLKSDILLVDEVLAVGDAEFQKKSLSKMNALANSGRTVLFVSHNLTAVANLCSKTIYLDKGKLIAFGPTSEVLERYQKDTQDSDPSRLSMRADRQGAGQIRLESLKILGPDSSPTLKHGENIRLIIGIENRSKKQHTFRLGVSLRLPDNTGLIAADSELVESNFLIEGKAFSQFECTIKKIPLNTGQFSVNLAVYTNQLEDWIIDAGRFNVIAKNTFEFRSGARLPVLSDVSWRQVS